MHYKTIKITLTVPEDIDEEEADMAFDEFMSQFAFPHNGENEEVEIFVGGEEDLKDVKVTAAVVEENGILV